MQYMQHTKDSTNYKINVLKQNDLVQARKAITTDASHRPLNLRWFSCHL